MITRRILPLLATTAILLAACAAHLQAPTCTTDTVAPTYHPNETWEYRTAAGDTVTQRVSWIDDHDTYFDWRNTAGPQYSGLTAQQSDNIEIASIGNTITSTEDSLPFPLHVGQAWSYQQLSYQRTGGPMLSEIHHRQVMSCEWVITPAGAFSALKILDTRTRPADPPSSYFAWYAPQTKSFVKRQHIQGASPETSALETDVELLHYSPAAP